MAFLVQPATYKQCKNKALKLQVVPAQWQETGEGKFENFYLKPCPLHSSP